MPTEHLQFVPPFGLEETAPDAFWVDDRRLKTSIYIGHLMALISAEARDQAETQTENESEDAAGEAGEDPGTPRMRLLVEEGVRRGEIYPGDLVAGLAGNLEQLCMRVSLSTATSQGTVSPEDIRQELLHTCPVVPIWFGEDRTDLHLNDDSQDEADQRTVETLNPSIESQLAVILEVAKMLGQLEKEPFLRQHRQTQDHFFPFEEWALNGSFNGTGDGSEGIRFVALFKILVHVLKWMDHKVVSGLAASCLSELQSVSVPKHINQLNRDLAASSGSLLHPLI